MPLCPYCNADPQDSDDHVFPASIGGRRTVRACKAGCNDRFGHEFEAAVADDLGPVAVLLSLCGLKLPKRFVWRQAYRHPPTGLEYDLESESKVLRLSAPKVERNEHGEVVRGIFRDTSEAERARASLEGKAPGKQYRVKLAKEEIKAPPLNPIRFTIGTEIRRLAVKVAIGAAELVLPSVLVVDSTTRAYLLSSEAPEVPVRIDYRQLDGLDSMRPPLAHLVFVEGDPKKRRCYAVVQFFGTIQLWTLISSEYDGQAFAVLGTCNVLSNEDMFVQVTGLGLDEAPQYTTQEQVQTGIEAWAKKLDKQVLEAFGENILTFNIESS